MEDLSIEQFGGWLTKGQELVAVYGLKVLAAFAILIVVPWVAKWIRRIVESILNNEHKVVEAPTHQAG